MEKTWGFRARRVGPKMSLEGHVVHSYMNGLAVAIFCIFDLFSTAFVIQPS